MTYVLLLFFVVTAQYGPPTTPTEIMRFNDKATCEEAADKSNAALRKNHQHINMTYVCLTYFNQQ